MHPWLDLLCLGMTQVRKVLEDVKPDGFEILAVASRLTGYMAFVSWANLIVRAVKGEAVEDGWRVWLSSAAYVGTSAFLAAMQLRAGVGTHATTAEARGMMRQAATDAEQREQRDAARDGRLYRVNTAMAILAGVTLAAAIVTLVVTLVRT